MNRSRLPTSRVIHTGRIASFALKNCGAPTSMKAEEYPEGRVRFCCAQVVPPSVVLYRYTNPSVGELPLIQPRNVSRKVMPLLIPLNGMEAFEFAASGSSV